MIFEYCETCRKVSAGGYLVSADKEIKIFLCRTCGALTCIESKKYRFNFFEHDIKLRNEAIKLQRKMYS